MPFATAAHIVVGIGFAVVSACAQEQNPAAIHQELDFDAAPQRIYQALLDAKQFSALTGLPAGIDPKAGGTFRQFGGRITGRNIELVPNQRIVQAWRDEAAWAPGVYSIVKFELRAQASGTHLIFDHTGIAPEDKDHLSTGWPMRYWDPLRKYLATGAPPPAR